ncbi:MAG: hypothetical protein Q9166_005239 [cf. Caloplaca sp. 2 TL-2023]
MAQNVPATELPTSFGILLFPGFEALDAFGPLNCLNDFSHFSLPFSPTSNPLTLSVLSTTLEPVSTIWPSSPLPTLGQSVVTTHTLDRAPPLDVLIVPGGMGLIKSQEELEPLVTFVRDTYPTLKYIISVCNGASLLAKAGILDGKRATTNKKLYNDVTTPFPRVNWISKARWVEDGNVWTSSGVSAGIDVMLAWIGKVYGEGLAQDIADGIEHTRHVNADDDPFAKVHGLS